MWKALRRMGTRDISRLPVIETEGSKKLIGMIRRRDIVRAYQSAIVKKAHHQHRIETTKLANLDNTVVSHITIPSDSPVVGKQVRDFDLPQECLVISVRRGRKLHIAHGYTVLAPNDIVTIFSDQDCIDGVKGYLTGHKDETT
jgi:CIC family chloride channel protein